MSAMWCVSIFWKLLALDAFKHAKKNGTGISWLDRWGHCWLVGLGPTHSTAVGPASQLPSVLYAAPQGPPEGIPTVLLEPSKRSLRSPPPREVVALGPKKQPSQGPGKLASDKSIITRMGEYLPQGGPLCVGPQWPP